MSSASAFAGVSANVSGLYPAARIVVIALRIETSSGSVPGAWNPAVAIASSTSLSLALLAGDEPPIAGGSRRNRDWVESAVVWAEGVPDPQRWLLCDAMTSGGLLVAAPEGAGAPGTPIGRLESGEPGTIRVV